MTEVQERRKKTVEASMTEQVHLIMQQHLNGGGRLFGGALMQWLDEVAGVVAMRHAETYRVVTAAVDRKSTRLNSSHPSSSRMPSSA